MRNNKLVTGAKAHGVAATGNPNPKANMPANNIGMHTVKIGGGKDSTFGNNVKTRGTGGSVAHTGTVNNVGAKLNTTNYVNTGNKVSLGHTKHAVGSVPAYLRNPANPK